MIPADQDGALEEGALERLLDRLRAGDITAAEQLFVAFEPYLRLLVRRQLSAEMQPKFDSVDVVQSIWADLVDGFRAGRWHFPDVTHFRGFLLKATQNRLVDTLRRHRRATVVETPLPDEPATSHEPLDQHPGPEEEVGAGDLWDKLVHLCPPQHRDLLELKRQGFRLGEIAARTGLHEGSVRRILYDLARRYATGANA